MSDKKDSKTKKQPSLCKRMKRETGKSLFFFTAGAVTATVAILNRKRKKRLQKKYRQQINELKARKKEA